MILAFQACRGVISELWENKELIAGASNPSLVIDKYLKVPAGSDGSSHPDARAELFSTVKDALMDAYGPYKAAFRRYTSSFSGVYNSANFTTANRMIIGLGGENVIETGLTLNRIYGTPYIPGTALKGLASHYCNLVWGVADPKFALEGEYHKIIFGETDEAGHFTFHDAWIVPECHEDSLKDDVMTPHHSDYYSEKDAPTDFDDPIPVTFLSVSGTFSVAISCDAEGEEAKKWNNLVFDLLSEALTEWGIGAKTNSGYGILVPENFSDNTDSITGEISGNNIIAAKKGRYNKGDVIRVVRIEDHVNKKGKARKSFIADDGTKGIVGQGDAPDIEIGDSCKMKVINFDPGDKRYTFAVPETGKKEKPDKHNSKRRY